MASESQPVTPIRGVPIAPTRKLVGSRPKTAPVICIACHNRRPATAAFVALVDKDEVAPDFTGFLYAGGQDRMAVIQFNRGRQIGMIEMPLAVVMGFLEDFVSRAELYAGGGHPPIEAEAEAVEGLIGVTEDGYDDIEHAELAFGQDN
jgi:hypothetical protein